MKFLIGTKEETPRPYEMEVHVEPLRTSIFGVSIDCVDADGLFERVMAWTREGHPRTIMYANAHCLNYAATDAAYRAILNSADMVYADGVGAIWGARMLSKCTPSKTTGADWIVPLCQRAASLGLRIYLLGGKPGIAQTAAKVLCGRVSGLQVVGTSDGYFSAVEEPAIVAEIQQAAPDILLVGMGVPRQERWIARHHAALGVPICWGAGAVLDYVADREPRAPLWMRRAALEWLWRLLVDPRGKWRRYLLGIPLFMGRVLRERVRQGLRQR
jgi:N-acetylglucosaminyldiphosphoundecaprenol N-acetyl-beta-D-mannosaminyltransferase